MPSLADIPANLLSSEKKHDFLTWLSSQPIETGPRRRLLSLWRQETNSDLDHADFVAAMRTAPDYPNHGRTNSLPGQSGTQSDEPANDE